MGNLITFDKLVEFVYSNFYSKKRPAPIISRIVVINILVYSQKILWFSFKYEMLLKLDESFSRKIIRIK